MISPIRLFNTLSRQVESLKTNEPGKVKLYCCGPTVYDYQHIGNMRTYIFEDILVRTLRYAGYEVNHVMNITDVGHLVSDADTGEDKILVAAKREKKSSLEIAAFYTKIFFDDCEKLHVKRPDIVCKATEHIQEMIELIKKLETRGITYVAGGNVYYDVSKFPSYGRLAKLDLEKLKAGARIEVDSNKKNSLDFVLWFTKSKFDNQELQWDSPWGRGYPGWHIECSAMSIKYLGEAFDIHCGGIDHIPVHHTNEIAQSEGATGKPWVNVWMHGEFLVVNKEKMSKSKGGFITLQTVIDKGIDPLAYRIMCLTGHYRGQLSFTEETLQNAANTLKKLKALILSLKAESSVVSETPKASYLEEFEQAIFDDLNLPKAFASVWAALGDSSLKGAQKLAILYKMDQVLGLGFDSWKEESLDLPPEVQTLISARDTARKNKDWKESDRLRDEITKLGYSVLDSKIK
ncbi:MAG: cysteine--tRNA ligase [bacterium]|nr:cysteine--tRNA ligase [bacterium]